MTELEKLRKETDEILVELAREEEHREGKPMNEDLPIWVNVVNWVLDIIIGVGNWCSAKSTALLDKHCGCEICKKDKRGRYRDRT